MKIDCAGCHAVALVTPAALLQLGLSPVTKEFDLTMRLELVARIHLRLDRTLPTVPALTTTRGGNADAVLYDGRLHTASS